MINKLNDIKNDIISDLSHINSNINDKDTNDKIFAIKGQLIKYLIHINKIILTSNSLDFLKLRTTIEKNRDDLLLVLESYDEVWHQKFEAQNILVEKTKESRNIMNRLSMIVHHKTKVNPALKIGRIEHLIQDILKNQERSISILREFRENLDEYILLNKIRRKRIISTKNYLIRMLGINTLGQFFLSLNYADRLNYNILKNQRNAYNNTISSFEEILSLFNDKLVPILDILKSILVNLQIKYENREVAFVGNLNSTYSKLSEYVNNKMISQEIVISPSPDQDFQRVEHISLLNFSILWFDHNYFIQDFDYSLFVNHNLHLKQEAKRILSDIDENLGDIIELIEKKHSYLLSKIIEDHDPTQLGNDFSILLDKSIITHDKEFVSLLNYQKQIEKYIPVSLSNDTGLNFIRIKDEIDTIKNIQIGSNLITSLEKHSKSIENSRAKLPLNSLPYDVYCYDVAINYVKFNLFSLKLKLTEKRILASEDFSFSDELKVLENKYIEADELVSKSKLYNYYPYRRFAEFLIDHIFLSEHCSDQDFNRYYELAGNLLDKFAQNLEWCKKTKFLPFQYPFNQSVIIDEKNHLNIFIASGISSPIDYTKEYNSLNRLKAKYATIREVRTLKLDNIKYNKTIQEYELALENFKSSAQDFTEKSTSQQKELEILSEDLENTQNIVDRAETKSLKFEEKLKDSEKNSIQILGIFSAIVLFTTGSISFFKDNIVSPAQAVAFILGYGFVLALFIIVLHFVFYYRYDKEKHHQEMHNKLLNYLLIGIGVIALFLVIHSKPILTLLNLTN